MGGTVRFGSIADVRRLKQRCHSRHATPEDVRSYIDQKTVWPGVWRRRCRLVGVDIAHASLGPVVAGQALGTADATARRYLPARAAVAGTT